MARLENDPRVVEVLAAFERMRARRDGHPADLCGFMSSVASTVVDRFTIPCDWPAESIRAVLLAFLLHAPDEDLDEMVGSARGEQVLITEMEAESRQEIH